MVSFQIQVAEVQSQNETVQILEDFLLDRTICSQPNLTPTLWEIFNRPLVRQQSPPQPLNKMTKLLLPEPFIQ